LVAQPGDQQVALLPDFVDVPSEVVEVFDYGWMLVPQIRDAGLLDDEQYAKVGRVNAVFEDMLTSADDLWTIDAMETHPLWDKTRELAVEALSSLGRAPTPPTLANNTWVPAGDESASRDGRD
jgi:hypothetical protein